MFKYILFYILFILNIYSYFNAYFTLAEGNYKVEERVDTSSLGRGIIGAGIEWEKGIYEQISFVSGILYEGRYEVEEASYNFASLYCGGKFYYYKNLKKGFKNPYIIGRFGYPYFLKKNNIDFVVDSGSGWGEFGLGMADEGGIFIELLYSQHGAKICSYNESYTVKLFSLKAGYRI